MVTMSIELINKVLQVLGQLPYSQIANLMAEMDKGIKVVHTETEEEPIFPTFDDTMED